MCRSVSSRAWAAIRQSLLELGLKLAEIHRTAAEAYLSQSCYDQALPHLEAAATFSPAEMPRLLPTYFAYLIFGRLF